MAERSTRNKVRYQAQMMQKHLKQVDDDLSYIEQLAEGKSAYINDKSRLLHELFMMVLQSIIKFREGL